MSDLEWVERPHGVRIPYITVGEGQPRRLVFAHSLTAIGTNGRPLFEPLAAKGWNTAILDQRGHGRSSPVTDPELLSVTEHARDLLAILDDRGWARAWLGGGSMGAAPALAAALLAPERVDGLVLLAPGFGATMNPARDEFLRIADAFEDGGFDAGAQAWCERFAARNVPQPVLDHQVQQLAEHDLASLICILRTVPGWTIADELSRVGELQMPVVVLSWDDDDIHPRALGEQIAEAAPLGRFIPITPAIMAGGPVALFDLTAQAMETALGETAVTPGG